MKTPTWLAQARAVAARILGAPSPVRAPPRRRRGPQAALCDTDEASDTGRRGGWPNARSLTLNRPGAARIPSRIRRFARVYGLVTKLGPNSAVATPISDEFPDT